MKSFRNPISLVMLFVLVCLVVGCAKTLPEEPSVDAMELPILSADPDDPTDLRVEAFCSETKVRTVLATLTWRTDGRSIDRQRIDITVYRGGFEKGLYTTLWPIKEKQRFKETKLSRLPDRPSNQSLYLDVWEVDDTGKEDLVSVKTEGLEPSLNYYWRVLTLNQKRKGWIPSKVVYCTAPICPADIKEDLE